jgi:16S rRNA (guanine1207-N2)-methyltransferase
MNPALETLILALSADGGPVMRSPTLFIGAEAHPAFKDWPELTGWQPLKPQAVAWDRFGFSRLGDLSEGKWRQVFVLPGKSRDEAFYGFALARERLEPGGKLLVAMPNTAGAGRFEKELAKATGNIFSLQKHKCRAFYATEDGTWNERLFQEWRALGGPRHIPGTDYTAEAGIFSCDHIDPGSQLLADHLPAHWHGEVADLGAGWGFLSDKVLQRCSNITRLDLFEADARALACARQNLTGHSREIGFHWHDVTTGLPGTYDAIVMNPPFHTGQATDVDLGRAFLKTATVSLRRGGKLLLVANRQLPYEAALEASGLAWRKVAEDKVYKILSAEKR